jgi:uncharacterized protein YlaN (UPF0358 family)
MFIKADKVEQIYKLIKIQTQNIAVQYCVVYLVKTTRSVAAEEKLNLGLK